MNSITVGQLSAALKTVLPLAKRPAAPIRGSVLLQQHALVATTRDCFVTHTIPLTAAGCLQHPRLLHRWLALHPQESQVEIEAVVESGIDRLQFSVGSAQLALNTLPADSFPALPSLQSTATVTLPAPPERAILYALLQSAVEQTGRPRGLHLRRAGNQIEWITCNGPRIVRARVDYLDCTGAPHFTLILPKIALQLLYNAPVGKPLEITAADPWASLQTAATRIIARTEADYPDVSRIPPNPFGTLIVERTALMKTLARCAPKEYHPGHLWLSVETETAQLRVESAIGREALPCKLLGGPFAIAYLDGKYLRAALRSLKGKAVYLQPGRGTIPTLVRSVKTNLEHLVAGLEIACDLPNQKVSGFVPGEMDSNRTTGDPSCQPTLNQRYLEASALCNGAP